MLAAESLDVRVPGRHPARPRPVTAILRGPALAFGIRPPDRGQWHRLGASLTVGDAAMDRLVEWMSSAGASMPRQLFERALTDGIAAVSEAPAELREFFAGVETAPEWVDWDRVRRGQRAMRVGGADGIYVARDVSLLGGYQFANFNQTLLRTGALQKGSNTRFAETFQWALDVIEEDGLQPQRPGYQSTLRVRLIHGFVRRHVAAMSDWRSDEWGLPVNQTDMAATLLGALIAPAVGAIGMGQIYTPAELNDIAHLTRYVGWLIGVDDQWLPHTFRDAVRGLVHTLSALSVPDETTKLLAMPMADDPLSWNFNRLPRLRRRVARAQHLSVASAYLGPTAMHTLGLRYNPPWYPLLRIPVNATRSIVALSLPGGRNRAAKRGWQQQQRFMQRITVTPAQIGNSATHITPHDALA